MSPKIKTTNCLCFLGVIVKTKTIKEPWKPKDSTKINSLNCQRRGVHPESSKEVEDGSELQTPKNC